MAWPFLPPPFALLPSVLSLPVHRIAQQKDGEFYFAGIHFRPLISALKKSWRRTPAAPDWGPEEGDLWGIREFFNIRPRK